MPRLLLLFLLLSPVEANQVTVDQLVHAYIHAGWITAVGQDGAELYCIGLDESRHADSIVQRIADRAKGVQCS